MKIACSLIGRYDFPLYNVPPYMGRVGLHYYLFNAHHLKNNSSSIFKGNYDWIKVEIFLPWFTIPYSNGILLKYFTETVLILLDRTTIFVFYISLSTILSAFIFKLLCLPVVFTTHACKFISIEIFIIMRLQYFYLVSISFLIY